MQLEVLDDLLAEVFLQLLDLLFLPVAVIGWRPVLILKMDVLTYFVLVGFECRDWSLRSFFLGHGLPQIVHHKVLLGDVAVHLFHGFIVEHLQIGESQQSMVFKLYFARTLVAVGGQLSELW